MSDSSNIAAVLAAIGKTNLDAVIQKLCDLLMRRAGKCSAPFKPFNYVPHLMPRKTDGYSNAAALDPVVAFGKSEAFWKAINASHSQSSRHLFATEARVSFRLSLRMPFQWSTNILASFVITRLASSKLPHRPQSHRFLCGLIHG